MMDGIRSEIELKLRGNLLRDWCRMLAESEETVEFQDAWCSGHRTLRLSTRTIEDLVDGWRGSGDCWGLRRATFYEVSNYADAVTLSLSVSGRGLGRARRGILNRLSDALAQGGFNAIDLTAEPAKLATWPIYAGDSAMDDVTTLLDDVWKTDVTFFEHALEAWMHGCERVTWRIPDSGRSIVPSADIQNDLFVEGAQVTILTDRFERSKAARKRCIAAHGTACAVCGTDFGALYGEQFAGKIEVHHKKPLCEIREDYEVDPVNDLVPVCPNCHMVLHSKPGTEPYTVEEVRSMLERDD